MNLYTKHCVTDGGLELQRVAQLREDDHRPTVEAWHAVRSRSSDRIYPVAKIRALLEPMGPDTDVVADETTFWVCACDDHWYNRTRDDGQMLSPRAWTECKHIRKVTRAKRAENDDHQQQL